MKFKVFGTKIYVSFLFLAFICLLLLVDKSGFLLHTVLAVSIHELFHLMAMWILGCNPKEVMLLPALIKIVRQVSSRTRNEVLISLMGPIGNILFFTLSYTVYLLCSNEIALTFALINMFYGALNLLPIKGLDGGLIMYKLMCCVTAENRAKLVLNFLTLILATLFLILGVTLLLTNKNISLIILSLYFLLSVLIKF